MKKGIYSPNHQYFLRVGSPVLLMSLLLYSYSLSSSYCYTLHCAFPPPYPNPHNLPIRLLPPTSLFPLLSSLSNPLLQGGLQLQSKNHRYADFKWPHIQQLTTSKCPSPRRPSRAVFLLNLQTMHFSMMLICESGIKT
jgi:hypothetical protein